MCHAIGHFFSCCSCPRAPQDPVLLRVYGAYARIITHFVDWIARRGYFLVGVVIATILLEPWSALRAGCEAIYYYVRGYHFSGINPTQLSREQLTKSPILFLHGNLHSPAACTSIARALTKAGHGPIFTVQLTNSYVINADIPLIETRIREIMGL